MDPDPAAVVAEGGEAAVREPEPVRVVGVDHDPGALLAADRGRGLRERRVEVVARGGGHEAERHGLGRLLDDRPVVREARRRARLAVRPEPVRPDRGPVRREPELPVRVGEPPEVVRFLERRLAVDPVLAFERLQPGPAGQGEGPVDDLALRHLEARVFGAEPPREVPDDGVVRPAFPRRLDDPGPEDDVLVSPALVDVVVLDEHRRGQDHVGDLRRLGHELLVHADEEVLAGEALVDQPQLRRDHHRVRVLDEHRGHRGAVAQVPPVAGEDGPDAGLVEHPDSRVPHVQPLDERPIPVVDRPVVVERAAPLVPPGARHRRDAQGRVHVDRAVSLAREPVAEPEEGPGGRADHLRQGLDRIGRDPGDRGRPLGGLARQMGFELGRAVGVALEVLPVRMAVPEEHVHQGARERAVGTGPHADQEVRLLRGRLPVHVDAHDLRAPLAPRPKRVGHHVDLGARRVGPPDDHEIGLRHLARVRPGEPPRPRDEPVPGEGGADRGVLPRVAHRVAEPVDPVALHEPHRARVVVGPHGLRAVAVGRPREGAGHLVERLVPPDGGERAPGGAAEGPGQAVRVVGPLRVARHLAAHHAGGVVVRRRAAHAADPPRVEALDLQRAGRGAVVGAGAEVDLGRWRRVHGGLPCGFGAGMIRHPLGRPEPDPGRGMCAVGIFAKHTACGRAWERGRPARIFFRALRSRTLSTTYEQRTRL